MMSQVTFGTEANGVMDPTSMLVSREKYLDLWYCLLSCQIVRGLVYVTLFLMASANGVVVYNVTSRADILQRSDNVIVSA